MENLDNQVENNTHKAICCPFQLGAGQAQSNRSLPLTL